MTKIIEFPINQSFRRAMLQEIRESGVPCADEATVLARMTSFTKFITSMVNAQHAFEVPENCDDFFTQAMRDIARINGELMGHLLSERLHREIEIIKKN